MKKVLIVAPHPDDETLGCGGSILKHIEKKDNVYCIFVTTISKSSKNFKNREKEINEINKKYSFKKLFRGKFLTSKLHNYDKLKIINFFSKIVKKIKPEIIYVPFREDAHSDHKIVYDSISPTFKTFRYPYIKDIRVYETISETNFKNNFSKKDFEPNLWVNISKYMNKKINIMKIYKGEIKKHPFPRSEKSIKALAMLRGSYSGFEYAEAFKIIKQLDD